MYSKGVGGGGGGDWSRATLALPVLGDWLELMFKRILLRAFAYMHEQLLIETQKASPTRELPMQANQGVVAEEAREIGSTMVIKSKTTSTRAGMSSLPSVCVVSLLQYLDMLSLSKACTSSKALLQDGTLVARCVYRHLVDANNASSPLPSPTTRTTQSKRSWSILAHDVFLANKRQEVLIMGGIILGGHGVEVVTKMIFDKDGSIRLEDATPMLQARSSQAGIFHNGEVFSISRGRVERLNMSTQTRTLLVDEVPHTLDVTTAVSFCDKLLLVGGQNRLAQGWSASDIVYELDEYAGTDGQTTQGTWLAHEARLVRARQLAAAIAFEGNLYVCGGYGTAGRLCCIEVFDPSVGTWRIEEDQMTGARAGFSLFIYEEELYAVGGNAGNTTIEKRNKTTKKWQHVADCGQARRACTAALVGSKIFLIGGADHRSTFTFFDLHTKKWASQDAQGAFFHEDTRQLPRQVVGSKAVLVSPPIANVKKWTNLFINSNDNNSNNSSNNNNYSSSSKVEKHKRRQIVNLSEHENALLFESSF